MREYLRKQKMLGPIFICPIFIPKNEYYEHSESVPLFICMNWIYCMALCAYRGMKKNNEVRNIDKFPSSCRPFVFL